MIAPFFPPEHFGGAGMHAFYLARGLGELRGVRVEVIAPGRQFDGGDQLWLNPRRVQVHRTLFDYEPGKMILAGTIGKSLAIVRRITSSNGYSRNSYTIINAQHYAGTFVGLNIKNSFNIPVVATIHKTPIGESLDTTIKGRDPAYSGLDWIAKQPLDGFIAGSRFFQSELSKYSLTSELIYHGVPVKWLRSRADIDGYTDKAREWLNITKDDKLVVCTMRWDSRKNPYDFLNAAETVLTETKDQKLKFLLTAQPPDALSRRGLNSWLKGRALEKNLIRATVPFDYMPAVIRTATLCVAPTKREGLGLSVLEAMALQKPVIATEAHGVDEIITNGQNGFLYADGEHGHLAMKMIELLENGKLKWSLIKGGKRVVSSVFDAHLMATKHEAFYRKICDGQKK